MCADVPHDVTWVIRQNKGRSKARGPWVSACQRCGLAIYPNQEHRCQFTPSVILPTPKSKVAKAKGNAFWRELVKASAQAQAALPKKPRILKAKKSVLVRDSEQIGTRFESGNEYHGAVAEVVREAWMAVVHLPLSKQHVAVSRVPVRLERQRLRGGKPSHPR